MMAGMSTKHCGWLAPVSIGVYKVHDWPMGLGKLVSCAMAQRDPESHPCHSFDFEVIRQTQTALLSSTGCY